MCADRKPYFFKYRYPACEREYNEFIEAKKMWARGYFHKSLEEVLETEDKDLTEEEIKFKDNYYKFCPLINYHIPMNQVCAYFE